MYSNIVMGKPLGRKAYGSIGHLPNSRLGPGDHKVSDGQAIICTKKARDKHDLIIIQEKLDGSCCAVARINNLIVPLSRAGWPAITSPYFQHRLFHNWVMVNVDRFIWLENDERVVGEWLALAHSTRYKLRHEPFVPFDIMKEDKRATFSEFSNRIIDSRLTVPFTISVGGPMLAEEALKFVQEHNHHGAIDPIEGVVYRVERKGKVDFLSKFVRPDKVDGKYFVETYGKDVWNWQPE